MTPKSTATAAALEARTGGEAGAFVTDWAGAGALDEPPPPLFPPPHALRSRGRSRAAMTPGSTVMNKRSQSMIAPLLDNADIDAGGNRQRKKGMAGECAQMTGRENQQVACRHRQRRCTSRRRGSDVLIERSAKGGLQIRQG